MINSLIRPGLSPDIYLMLLRCKCYLSVKRPEEAMGDVDAVLKYTNNSPQVGEIFKGGIFWVTDD